MTKVNQRLRVGVVALVLVVLLVLSVLLSAAIGQIGASLTDVIGVVLRSVGIHNSWEPSDPIIASALTAIRFPRIAMALLVGLALAAAGVIMQAIFANPLADPSVVGVSSGAAVGASASIVFGLTAAGAWVTPTLAFGTGLATTLFVYSFARSGGRTEVVTLLLTGIAVNAFAGAALALFQFLGTSSSREQIVFWQLGSMNGSRWDQVLLVACCVVVGLIGVGWLARPLDLLSLGDRPARHLGVNVERARLVGIGLVALLVGVSVAFTGVIAFVGLVVPHMMRMLVGPAHRGLLLVSGLAGAVLLTLADLVARTAIPSADLPIGMLTSLIGGPYFFYLLWRMRKQQGGLA